MDRVRMCFWTSILAIALSLISITQRPSGATQATWEVYSGATAPGSTTVPAIKSALQAGHSLHAGAAEPSYKTTGTPWWDSDDFVLKLYDGTQWLNLGLRIGTKWVPYSSDCRMDALDTAIADGETTINAGTGVTFSTANTTPTTIDTINNGALGLHVRLVVTDANTTIDGGLTRTGMTIPLVVGDTLEWTYNGTSWMQTGGNVGMGVFVPVVERDQIGDWIAPDVTAYADVDVSDDGVRKGACSVAVNWYGYKNAGVVYSLGVRRNGDTNGFTAQSTGPSGVERTANFIIALDGNAKFEAQFGASWATGTTNVAYVLGYWI